MHKPPRRASRASRRHRRKLWVTSSSGARSRRCVGIALMTATVAFVFWMYGRDPNLPNIEKLSRLPPQAGHDDPRRERSAASASSVPSAARSCPYDKIPPIVVDAFIAAEDNNFWTHGGVDYSGMVRAFFANLRAGQDQGGRVDDHAAGREELPAHARADVQAQDPGDHPRAAAREGADEAGDHDAVPEPDLLRRRRYGVQEAARFYFGKDIAQIDVGEAAVLASLPKEPETLYHSLRGKKPERVKDRQTYVLNQMVEDRQDHAGGGAEVDRRADQGRQGAVPELGRAPEWVDLVKKELVAHEAATTRPASTSSARVVRTTLDPALQATAQKALQTGLRAVDKRHKIGRPMRYGEAPTRSTPRSRSSRSGCRQAGPRPQGVYDAVVTAVHDDDQGARGRPRQLAGRARARRPRTTRASTRPTTTARRRSRASGSRSATWSRCMVVPAAQQEGRRRRRRSAGRRSPSTASTREVRAGPRGRGRDHRRQDAQGARARRRLLVEGRRLQPRDDGEAPAGLELQAVRVHGRDRQPASSRRRRRSTTRPRCSTCGSRRTSRPASSRARCCCATRSRSRSTPSRSPDATSVKPENVVAFAHKMGIRASCRRRCRSRSASGEVTPLEMTNAFATLAAGGIATAPRFVDAIDGKATRRPRASRCCARGRVRHDRHDAVGRHRGHGPPRRRSSRSRSRARPARRTTRATRGSSA